VDLDLGVEGALPEDEAVEAIALLDMMVSFADLVVSDESGPWTRPEITGVSTKKEERKARTI